MNHQDYLPVYCQHFGVSKDMNAGNPLYQSARVNSLQKAADYQNPEDETQEPKKKVNKSKGELIPTLPLFKGSPKEEKAG
ncbi:hypothetical protein SYJ56_24650 [Algoriphagus sp. D3-2-R+10]|uniref:hypothetical protein n=1 Tax=Algoriphagus aurantiacus TaxID=3103948 RepID=UPI002B3EAD16|nr:hypothetical protein [Algoriphagus sp. D3-2-R+10]MEB2778522.1 hypothetical protein [Algoriphagus sp. D3-2-R+10]